MVRTRPHPVRPGTSRAGRTRGQQMALQDRQLPDKRARRRPLRLRRTGTNSHLHVPSTLAGRALADRRARDGMGAPRHATASARRSICDKFSGVGGTRRAGGRRPRTRPAPRLPVLRLGRAARRGRGRAGRDRHGARRPHRGHPRPPGQRAGRGPGGATRPRGNQRVASRAPMGAAHRGRASARPVDARAQRGPHRPPRCFAGAPPQILATEAADAGLVTYGR